MSSSVRTDPTPPSGDGSGHAGKGLGWVVRLWVLVAVFACA